MIMQLFCLEVPFAPTDVTITNKTARTVSLSWTAPFNGNMPIIKYTVQYPGVIEVTMDSKSSITVGNLHPYRNYTFTVAATNGIGTGNFSDPSPQVETNQAGTYLFCTVHIYIAPQTVNKSYPKFVKQMSASWQSFHL